MGLRESIKQNRQRFSIRIRRKGQNADNAGHKSQDPLTYTKPEKIIEEAEQEARSYQDSSAESCKHPSAAPILDEPEVENHGFIPERHASTQETHPGNDYNGTSITGNARVIQGNPVFVTNVYNTSNTDAACNVLLKSLSFAGMDARARNIAAPLPQTCEWLFENLEFRCWTARDRAETHRNFLWIKGKPGSGKSTLMRECMLWAERTWTQELVLPYFFNARSAQGLDKSSLGLYRAFVYKLVVASDGGALRELFYTTFESKIKAQGRQVSDWTVIELQNFLTTIVVKKLLPPCNMLIDALDEGDEEDVRRMIGYFEDLGDRAASYDMPLRICLSSRHFPFISIAKGLTIVLETQISHRADLQTYINTKLRGAEEPEMDELKQRILAKSANVFLWVILVIPMLNHIYDQGEGFQASLDRLATIPPDLHDLFSEILSRHEDGLEECTSLFRWLLFSRRLLRPRELYTAVRIRFVPSGVPGLGLSEGAIFRYLLNCSRGLVEVTEQNKVQFIHETVRDFLLYDHTTHKGKKTRVSSINHARFGSNACNTLIAEDCLQLIHTGCTSTDWSPNRLAGDISSEVLLALPLMQYAATYWHRHLHYSQTNSVEADDMIFKLLTGKSAVFGNWQRICRESDVPLEHRLDLPHLSLPLFYAVFFGIHGVVRKLVDAGADVNAKDGGSTALYIARKVGYDEVAAILLHAGADVNGEGPEGPPLVLAAKDGQTAMVNLFIQKGADVDACGPTYRRALWEASKLGHTHIVEALLRGGADCHAQERRLNGSPVLIAIEEGHIHIVRMLLDSSTDNAPLLQPFGLFVNTLHFALAHKKYEIAILLLKGMDLVTRLSLYVRTFRYALDDGRHETIISLIAISKYAGIDFPDALEKALEITWTTANLGYFSGDEDDQQTRRCISRSQFNAITGSQAVMPCLQPFRAPDSLDAALPTADYCAHIFYS